MFINQLNEKFVKLRSIAEPFLDTADNSSHSQFIANLFAILAQLEHDIIIERTQAGLASARAK